MNCQYKNVFIVLFLFCFMPLIVSNYVVAEESSNADMTLGKKACRKKENLIDQILCYADLATKLDDVLICNAAFHEGVRYQC